MTISSTEQTDTDCAQLGWLIAFIASIIADIEEPYPKYAWWTLAYMLCCVIGITIVFACDSANHYSIAVSGLSTVLQRLLTLSDRRVPGSRPRHDHISCQLSRLPARRHNGSCCGRLHPSLDRCCTCTGPNILSRALTFPDHLDLLLRLRATSHPSQLRRLLRPSQRPPILPSPSNQL